MAKDKAEESQPEDVIENQEEWDDESPALESVEEEPVVEEEPAPEKEAPKGVTFIRQPNGKLVPYEAGMDNR